MEWNMATNARDHVVNGDKGTRRVSTIGKASSSGWMGLFASLPVLTGKTDWCTTMAKRLGKSIFAFSCPLLDVAKTDMTKVMVSVEEIPSRSG